jgi:hypothetical protein
MVVYIRTAVTGSMHAYQGTQALRVAVGLLQVVQVASMHTLLGPMPLKVLCWACQLPRLLHAAGRKPTHIDEVEVALRGREHGERGDGDLALGVDAQALHAAKQLSTHQHEAEGGHVALALDGVGHEP